MRGPSDVRVLVADDHPLFRDGVVRQIERTDGLQVAGEASTGIQALGLIRRLAPDVAVLDLKMPVMDAIQVTVQAIRDRAETGVLIVSGFADPAVRVRAFRAGARGVLSKECERSQICEAVKAVAAGELVSGELPEAMVSALPSDPVCGSAPLSAREREILELMAAGVSGPQAARLLGLSPGTIKTHTQHLFRKLSVNDRAAAVAQAMRQGVLR
jgi:two-component system nitrate/nitrite response regulator NarL